MMLQSGNGVELEQFTGLSLEKYNPSLQGTRQVYASSMHVRSGLPRMEERKGAVTCPPCLLSPLKISSGCPCGSAQERKALPLAGVALPNQ